MKKAKILADLIERNEQSRRAFAERIGVPATTLQSILTRGVGKASVDNVIKVCRGLGITTEDLERMANGEDAWENITPIKIKKIPMLGEIAAGEPIMVCEEPSPCLVGVDDNRQVDFCLKVKGDSMIDARINDGDIVFIRKQQTVENGEIAAIIIDDEATLKRFYKNNGGVILKPENAKYQPKYYTAEDFKDIRILGKAIFFQSEVH